MSEQNDQLFSMSFYSSNTINDEKISDEITNLLGSKKYDLNTEVAIVKNTLENIEEWKKEDYIWIILRQLL